MCLRITSLIVLVTGSLLYACNAQSNVTTPQLMCPTAPLVITSPTDNNELVFLNAASLNSSNDDVSYNPGALGPYYDIGSGIINVVQPGSVTRDVVVPILFGNNGTRESVNNLIPNLLRQWVGLIILFIFGILLSCSFCVCGICFGICRCCGNCGGDLKQEETSSMNCLTIVFTVILIVLTCGLIAGIIMAFFSNQQVFDSAQQLENTVDRSFSRAGNFVNDSLTEIDNLICQLDDILDIVVEQARELISNTSSVVNRFSGDIYDIVDTTISLSSALESVQSSLYNIEDGVNTLQSNASNLNISLQNIGQQVTALASSCSSLSNYSAQFSQCSNLDPTVFTSGLLTNFQQLPDVTGQLRNVRNVLSDLNLTNLAKQGNTTFNNAISNIQNITSTANSSISSAVNQLRNGTANIRDPVHAYASPASRYLSLGQDYVNIGFGYVRQYDTPRFAVSIVVSFATAIVVVVVFLALICGLCGFRTDRAPYERTDLSNCGGITLLCAVALGFIFGFLVILLAAIVFFSGGFIQKLCDDLEGPQYIGFAETIDNPTRNNGQYFLSQLILQNGSIPLTVSGILTSCSQSNTVFNALKLNQSGFYQQIQQFTNITQFVPNVTGDIGGLTNEISNLISPQTFVPQSVQSALNNFTSTGVEGINITQFTDQISRAILSFNITERIVTLTSIRNTLNNATNDSAVMFANLTTNVTSAVNQTDAIIVNLEQLRTDINNITQQLNKLTNQVEIFDNNTQQLRDGIDDLLTNINTTFENLIQNGINPIVSDVQSVFPRAVGYAQRFVDHALSTIQNNIGNCFPVYAAYTELYNSICEFTLDGLNGFWLSLGMCGIFLIPVIIFAIVTSQYFRRMKYVEDLGIPYEDSFPLKTY